MKIKLLLLCILMHFLEDVCCDNFLSKFHQHDFKMKDLRMQLMSFDKNHYNFFRVVAFKYNRTTTAHNITFNGKIDTHDKIEILVQVYKFLSNEYREFPVRFQVNFQKAYRANVLGLMSTAKCGNFTTCYFYKNTTYHMCNFVIDETHLPPLIPSGKYNTEVQFLYLNQPIATLNCYGEVYTPIKYPK